ncbi:MAG: hypothetical protein ACKOB7_04550, partial [Methylocystis sp.]
GFHVIDGFLVKLRNHLTVGYSQLSLTSTASALLKNSEYILFGIKTNYIGLSKIVIAAILALEKKRPI